MPADKPTELSRIKLKNLNSTAHSYDQQVFSPLDLTHMHICQRTVSQVQTMASHLFGMIILVHSWYVTNNIRFHQKTLHSITWHIWWCHQMETFTALLALCAGNLLSPVNSPHKGQWHRALVFFFDLCLNKQLSKQSRCWWFEMPSRSLWHHCNDSYFMWHNHDDVIKWKHFPRYWPFVRGIHQSPVNSPHKGQWRGALMFSLICIWINDWVNNREAGD